ncbi:MAG: aminomethyl-transferring glycine dehydrogenase [Acidimicrobiia bacterium]|nr:aminomethyl-transferring glycine dehydrogenase [Acidimicrobiia bacterium]
MRRSLPDLEQRTDFVRRHLGPGPAQQRAMLDELGIDSLADLLDKAVPKSIRWDGPLDLPAELTETEAIARLRQIAGRNTVVTSMIGMGYYDTITPPVIQRNVLENPAWYTAYTPYQPEISQGRLEALLNFQTMVSDLTGMDLANASLLDEGTAAAEAMALCNRVTKTESDGFFVDEDCHPQTLAVLETRAEPLGIKLRVGPAEQAADAAAFGALLHYPGSSGTVRDLAGVAASLKQQGTLVAVTADLLSLVVLAPPGEWGADMVVGSSQRFGVPLGYGGPHAGFMSVREEFTRALPGRLVGVTLDDDGHTAYRLALQTREQHIRRQKATSNICTAQVLLAVMAGLYASYHGPDGLRTIAGRVHRLTTILAAGLAAGDASVVNESFFDTLTVAVPGRADAVLAAALEAGINLRYVDADTIGVSVDETTTTTDIEAVWGAFGVGASVNGLDATVESPIPAHLQRDSDFLTHPVFHRYHSETEMLRYLRRLADKDVALDRSMIPLGSCTMKLNATTEMVPVTWPEFANLHPFAPLDQAAGYLELFAELEAWLVEITGYDAVSLQPNAGSQGEFAGLLAIRAYHRSRGDDHRDICLIPASAHGTNPASAAMAGLKVVVVGTDEQGNIDLDDLIAKAEEHRDSLAALMVTYPSTHGVFEAAITDVCRIVHENGGQVYLDGANLNAMVGVAKPGEFGADVSHLNLHKTFCIPHGGGGPGVGPIGVKSHLAPFLPNHPLATEAGPETGAGAVSAAPFGSPGVLPISWMFIALMSSEGLTASTEVAILNANYVAHRLAPAYPILYTGAGDLVAHECILDLRPITKATHVTADDVAKRLMDFGFHAPTMSFPVPGTLMIEPTESESQAELDRFCDAMLAIKSEIDEVAGGKLAVEDSPLRRAPHTAFQIASEEWSRPYTREQGAFPVASLREAKYWPPVGRIDHQYGDRNIMCACPPIESYE